MARSNLAQCYREQGRLRLSEKAFQRSYDLTRTHFAHDLFLSLLTSTNLLTIKGLVSEWRDLEELESALLSKLAYYRGHHAEFSTSSGLTADSVTDPYTLSLARYASRDLDKWATSLACGAGPIFEHRAIRRTTGRLRLGYLSYDWRNHPMGRLTVSLVTAHNASLFAVSLYSYGQNDGSDVRRRVASQPDVTFRDVAALRNDYDVASLVHADQIDVLVDLTSHTYNGRIHIPALKPAPVVINYLGFAGTTGCRGVDYTMLHPAITPPEHASSLFTEKMLYLPHSYQANSMPWDVLPCIDAVCKGTMFRYVKTLSVSGGGNSANKQFYALQLGDAYMTNRIVLCSFNANKKLEPLTWQAWMNVLREIPAAVLVLLETITEVKENLAKQALFHGIAPRRLLFIGKADWAKHLQRASQCHLVLDSFVYGAHTTATDVLWMGIPLLTLKGFGSERMPSRVASSLLQALAVSASGHMGHMDSGNISAAVELLVSDSVRQYEAIVKRIVSSKRMLHNIRMALLQAAVLSPTFDEMLMERSVERAYRAAYALFETSKHMHVAGLPRDAPSEMLLAWRLAESMERFQGSLLECAALKHAGVVTLATSLDIAKLLLSCNFDASSAEIASTINKHLSVARRLSVLSPAVLLRVTSIAHDVLRKFAMLEKVEESAVPVLHPCYGVDEPYCAAVDATTNLDKISCCSERWAHALIGRIREHRPDLFQGLFVRRIAGMQHSVYDGGVANDMDVSGAGVEVDLGQLSRTRWHEWSDLDVWKVVTSRILPALAEKQSCTQLLPAHDLDSEEARNSYSRELIQWLEARAVSETQEGRLPEALNCFLSAFLLDPNYFRLLNAGLTLMDMNLSDFGFLLASIANVRLHLQKFSPGPQWPSSGVSSSKTVVFYCHEYSQGWWTGWGPSRIRQGGWGMGGSEEAVYYTSVELAKMGHVVYIYGDFEEQDSGVVEHHEGGGGEG